MPIYVHIYNTYMYFILHLLIIHRNYISYCGEKIPVYKVHK